MRKRSSKQPKTAPGRRKKATKTAAKALGPANNGANKNPAAVALGRLRGKKGGPARAAKLSKKQLSAITSCAPGSSARAETMSSASSSV